MSDNLDPPAPENPEGVGEPSDAEVEREVFAEENAIPINVTKRSPFSIDQNVWGRAVETGFLEHLFV